MEFDSYKDLTKNADIHIAFLKKVNSIADNLKDDETLSAGLSKIKVGGKPFSTARHLTTLEDNSDAWDLVTNQIEDKSAVSDVKKVEIVQLTKAIMAKDPSYDLAHHTTAYQAMTNDLASRNVSLEMPPASPVGAGLIKTLATSPTPEMKPHSPRFQP